MSKRGIRAGLGGSVSRGYLVILKRGPAMEVVEYDHATLAEAKQRAFALAHLHGLEVPDVENIKLDHYHGVLIVDATEFYTPIEQLSEEAGL